MKYAPQYLKAALNINNLYKGEIPFHLFLKKYFSANKSSGSKDRKQIASLCYNYFRLGKAFRDTPVDERILLGTFLCEQSSSAFLENIRPELNSQIERPLIEKLSLIDEKFSGNEFFPFTEELSEGINSRSFNISFLIQPDLFLRIRPGNHKKVMGKLSGAGINYKLVNKDCLALPNSSKIETVIDLDNEAVVQDYNSQRVEKFIKLQTTNYKLQTKVWDCCAASGGKSIMAFDIDPSIDLTVSDKRSSILQNLEKRFEKAGIKKYHSFVADLSRETGQAASTGRGASGDLTDIAKDSVQVADSAPTVPTGFDLIICDAPCTGSGTWSRTPEQLFYFDKALIAKYASLQKKIIENIIPHLKPGGQLLYITCSVFKKENEEVVNYIQEKFNLQLVEMKLLKGYDLKADTLFAALFKS
jgi:16S rRNA (cytosine967-C5)-methyltransferase